MADRKQELLGNPEFDALKDLDIDVNQILGDAGDPLAGDPPAGDPPAGDPPAGDPPAGKGRAGDPPSADQLQAQRASLLKEIFGEEIQTVEGAKQILDEAKTLRQTKADLEKKLNSKPKTNFASDEVALFNEFVRETGVKDFSIFSKIQAADLANMEPMDALVVREILKSPETLIGKEALVRKMLEKRYNVLADQEGVDPEDLEINKLNVATDGRAAIKELKALKEKLKVPEPSTEPDAPKELTPEAKATLTTGWTKAGDAAMQKLAQIPIPIKGGKDPLMSYVLSEDDIRDTKKLVVDYAIQNQMELTADNVKSVLAGVYNSLILSKLPEIVHSVFEKARKMTDKEVTAMYHNPSPGRNQDQPPIHPAPTERDIDQVSDEIFEKEMNRS